MLVLTCLLCLYTLFQSSLSDVPKTAYLKYIDYWNLFALAVSFINFTILVLWEIGNYKQQGKLWTTIKSIMRIAMPLITFFGVTYYWIMAGKISEILWKIWKWWNYIYALLLYSWFNFNSKIQFMHCMVLQASHQERKVASSRPVCYSILTLWAKGHSK